MTELDRKAALVEKLNKYLDGDAHSLPDLSYRFTLVDFKENQLNLFTDRCLNQKVDYVDLLHSTKL